MQKNIGIYIISNMVNGKFYIGSSVDLKKRKRDHLRELRNNIHRNERMQKSFNKYGEKNFKFEVIEIYNDKKTLREREQDFINETKCHDLYIGFNINRLATGGGNHGETNGNFGNRGGKNHLSKRFAQIDIETLEVVRIWDSSMDIKRELGVHGGNICKISLLVSRDNIWKKSHGYYWCYEKDLDMIQDKVDFVHSQHKEVLQIDIKSRKILNTFSKIQDAAKKNEINCENISRCCKGKNSTAAGFVWVYKEDYNEELLRDRISKALVEMNRLPPNAKNIVQLSMDGSYVAEHKSINKAFKLTGICRSSIDRCCGKIKNYKTAGGYKWMYQTEYPATKHPLVGAFVMPKM